MHSTMGRVMRKRTIVLAAAAILWTPLLAAAPGPGIYDPDNKPDQATSTDEAHLDEMVCKMMSPPTGSRLGAKKVCMTNRQWMALWDSSKAGVRAMQNKSLSKGGGGV